AAALPLEDVSANLIWLLVPGLLGALVVLCVVLLLLPHQEEDGEWEIGTRAALQKGQYLQHLTR
ncbi:MAG: hypothetical protein GTO31_10770, partial [Xanthomonadales bacterium]|nr:hypothetical protein [Xanthomonadales bacterium]